MTKPKSTITIKAHGRKVRITLPTNDPTIRELANAIRDALKALSYADKTIEEHLGHYE